MDHFVDHDSIFPETIVKLLDFVGGFKSEVVVGEERTKSFSFAKGYQTGYVDLNANVEVWFVEVPKKLENLASRPRVEIQVSCHVIDCMRFSSDFRFAAFRSQISNYFKS